MKKKPVLALLNRRVLAISLIFVLCLILVSLLAKQGLHHRAGSGAPKPPEKAFNAQTATLDNGLEIIVIPNHRAPVVTHMVWYKTGAADEEIGLSGIAHFLEHLMFKGSAGLAPGEFSETVRKLGGEDNAFTSQDFTAYFQSIAKDNLSDVMRMEAGRMRGLAPPLEEIESERNVIIEERAMRTDNHITARVQEQMRALNFINHPYGIPVIGWKEEMKILPWDKIKAFYDTWYGPNNAILVVTGDITMESLLPLAKQFYGSIPMVQVPTHKTPQIPPLPAGAQLDITDKDIHQPSLSILMRLPSMTQDQDFALAMSILEEILSSGPSTQLYQALVTQQKLATTINLSYRGTARHDAELWINATPAQDVSLSALKAALLAELQKAAQTPFTKERIETAQSRLIKEAIFARDSLTGPAMIIGQARAAGIPLDVIEYWPALIKAVTAEQIQNAAQTLSDALQSNKASVTTAYLKPVPATQAPTTQAEDDK